MFENPFIDLSEAHDIFDQDTLIIPSYAPVTKTFYEKDNIIENESSILSHILPKTSNTVTIKNLNFRSNKVSVDNLLHSFGEVSSINHNILKGFVIATFYDSRSAERFVKAMDGSLFNQRRIRCDLLFEKQNPYDNKLLMKCPNVMLKPLNISDDLVSEKVIQQFIEGKYGELRQIIKCNNGMFVLEFFDFRNAQNLVHNSKSIQISNIIFQPNYIIDISQMISNYQNEQLITNKYGNSQINLI